MGYADNNLITGEVITYRSRLHWILFLKPALICFGVSAVTGVLLYKTDAHNMMSGGTAVLILVAAVILSAIPLLRTILSCKSAEFSVTNKRVILKVGFIQSRTAEMFLNKIERVDVVQTIVGRVLGYGDIVIRGTGGSLEPFRDVADPLRFRTQIQEQISKTFETPSRSTSTKTDL